MSLTTHNVNKLNSEEVAYVYYTLPDLTVITKCSSQAMPLLIEVQTVLDKTKLASEKAYNEKIAQEIRIEKLSSEKSEVLASIDKQEDTILKLTKELEDANELAKANSLDTNGDAAEALKDAQAEIEKLKVTLSESTSKLEQAGAYFKSQLEISNNEANQAKEAEAEIREEIQKLKDTNKRLGGLAEKATDSLEQLKKSVASSSTSYTTPTNKLSAHQIHADKLEETFKRVMAIGASQSKAASTTSEIIIDGDEKTNYTARNSHQFKIKMDSTLPTFNGSPDSNVSEWLHATKRILDACP
jgi:chromosome segregation ATPase